MLEAKLKPIFPELRHPSDELTVPKRDANTVPYLLRLGCGRDREDCRAKQEMEQRQLDLASRRGYGCWTRHSFLAP